MIPYNDASPADLASLITDACFFASGDTGESIETLRSRFLKRAFWIVHNIYHGPTAATATMIERLIRDEADWALPALNTEEIQIRIQGRETSVTTPVPVPILA